MGYYNKLFFILTILFLITCKEGQFKTPGKAMDKLEAFKKKEKFIEDNLIFYPGISDQATRSILTDKIHLAVDNFMTLAASGKATSKDYQNTIKAGLQRFDDIYINLDTEDRERICSYFEELMDIVGLECSDGQLNNFMYGFDPKEKE